MRTDDHVSTSKFYMLRCLIAMAHIDGVVTEEEHSYISAILNRIPLTAQQRETLEDDFDRAQDIPDLLRHINEPRFRGQLVDFARILAYKDGVLHPSEEDMLQKLRAYAMDGIDLEGLRAQVQQSVASKMAAHDIEVDKNRPHRHGHIIPWFQLLDEFLLSRGIDLIKD